ncbi:MAG: site-specific integrase [Carboxydocellales bacterium]
MKGCFFKRGKTWSYTIDVGVDPTTGERKQKGKGGFATKKAAQLAAALIMQELEAGTYQDENKILFKDFAEEWLKLYAGTGKVKISTVRVRRHEMGALMPYFANIQLRHITKRAYQNALNGLKEEEYALNTMKGINRTGKMIFEKAMEMGIIKTDPTIYAQVPVVQKTVEELEEEGEIPKYLEKQELALLLQTARDKGITWDYPMFLLLAYSGMRVGEVLALKWKDINSETGEINITKTYYNPTNNMVKFHLLPPKTKTSRRVITVDPIVSAELDKHRSYQNIVKMKFRKVYFDKDFVFTKYEKNPGYPELIKIVETRMARLLKLAGLNTDLTPHSLRHTHTSLLAEAGVDLTQIMERLGHSDDQTTKGIYLHVTKTMKKEASQKFAQLMESL